MRGLKREVWMILTYTLLLVLSLLLVLFGLRTTEMAHGYYLLVAGIVCVIVTAGLIPSAVSLIFIQRHLSGISRRVEKHGEQLELLTRIDEHTMLSDSAKRIAYRRKEREMLRKAIEEDIAREEWDAAMVLVEDMAERFGYREEAEEFRQHIEQVRSSVVSKRLDEAFAQFNTILEKRDWANAYAEAARLRRLFPESPQVQGLEKQVRQAWEDHKHLLERQFLDTASRGEVDNAMELLKELDQYLSPREAEPYQEVARGVINRTRENLGLQFKMALQNKKWNEAIEIGQDIMSEFPNTLMAREVREHIDLLRLRAAGGEPEGGAGTRPDEPVGSGGDVGG